MTQFKSFKDFAYQHAVTSDTTRDQAQYAIEKIAGFPETIPEEIKAEMVEGYRLRHSEIKKPVKLVRFYKSIRKLFNEVTNVAQNDHGVSKEEFEILDRLEETFRTTEIDIPKTVMARGKEAIVNFVEQQYASRYSELKYK